MKFLFLILLFFSFGTTANEILFGSWKNDDGLRIDLIDGFKPNVGPAIVYDAEELTEVNTWSVDNDELQIGYNSGTFILSADNNSMEWNYNNWTRVESLSNTNLIDLKIDTENFINELTTYTFYSYSKEFNLTKFETTFSTTEGVITQFDEEDNIGNLSSWGVGSGIIKIGDDVFIEAKISENYFIAVDDRDEFIVLNKGSEKNILEKISLIESREQFLLNLKSGAWIVPSAYSADQIFRFRPIEGDLKGRVFSESENKLSGSQVWEFSPSTGAFKIGYTDYNAGLSLGDEILVFLEDDGDQYTLYKSTDVENKSFTVSDAKNITISERDSNLIKELISIVSSKEDQFTFFEFKDDNLSGYLHEWRSYPFQITGQTLFVEDNYTFNNTENIYLVEDYLIFGESDSRKIDLRETRLKPKTDAEAQADSEQAQNNVEQLSSKNVKLKIDLTNGKSETIILPVESFESIKSISVVEE